MKKTENVYITHVLFPWETLAAQSEREARERASGGDRWTEDFLREVRENVLRYANEPFFPPDEFKHAEFMNTSMRNSCLNDVYSLVPLHFREEVFAGVSFPIWNQGGRGDEHFRPNHGKPAGVGGFPASDSGDQCAVGCGFSSHLLRSVRGGKLRQLPE